MALNEVLGQPHAIATLERALERDRLASAYLFEGPSGVGKMRTAVRLAVAAIAGSNADIRRRIEASTHPDVRVFAPRDDKTRNLPVEFVRSEILPYTKFAPFEAAKAFVIFPDADISFPEQHAEAANALLKTLEEPRPGLHFILLSSRPDRLLTTIRSRCQRVRFQRLDDDRVERILAERGVPDAARSIAVALAEGRADRAEALASGVDAAFAVALKTDGVIRDGDVAGVLVLAEELAKLADFAAIVEMLALYYRDVARAASGMGDGQLALRHEAHRIRERAQTMSAAEASDVVLGLRELTERLEANANRELAITEWLLTVRSGSPALRTRRR